MSKSVLEAIEAGDWNFEPAHSEIADFNSTDAEPGSTKKLEILAERIRLGLPLWHPEDRHAEDGALLEKLQATLMNAQQTEISS